MPTHAHSTDDITSGILSIERGGTGNSTGLAASATKLADQRSVRVNLSSTSYGYFDGTADITPGVTGTLPITRGGTGYTSLEDLKTAMNLQDAGIVIEGTFVADSSGRSGMLDFGVRGNVLTILTEKGNVVTGKVFVVCTDTTTVSFKMGEGTSTMKGILLNGGLNTMSGLTPNATYGYVAFCESYYCNA